MSKTIAVVQNNIVVAVAVFLNSLLFYIISINTKIKAIHIYNFVQDTITYFLCFS